MCDRHRFLTPLPHPAPHLRFRLRAYPPAVRYSYRSSDRRYRNHLSNRQRTSRPLREKTQAFFVSEFFRAKGRRALLRQPSSHCFQAAKATQTPARAAAIHREKEDRVRYEREHREEAGYPVLQMRILLQAEAKTDPAARFAFRMRRRLGSMRICRTIHRMRSLPAAHRSLPLPYRPYRRAGRRDSYRQSTLPRAQRFRFFVPLHRQIGKGRAFSPLLPTRKE